MRPRKTKRRLEIGSKKKKTFSEGLKEEEGNFADTFCVCVCVGVAAELEKEMQ